MSSCKVCSKTAPDKSSCLCGTIYCSKACQRSEFDAHIEDCLTIGFGWSGHYAFFFESIPENLSDNVKTLWKSVNMGFLMALQRVKMGEKISGKDLKAVWSMYHETAKLLKETVGKQTLMNLPKKPTLKEAPARHGSRRPSRILQVPGIPSGARRSEVRSLSAVARHTFGFRITFILRGSNEFWRICVVGPKARGCTQTMEGYESW